MLLRKRTILGAKVSNESHISQTQTALVTSLTSLAIARDTITQHWTTFLVTAQTALGVALGFLMQQEPKTGGQRIANLIFVVAIPLFAMAITKATVTIVRRERQWQQWFCYKLYHVT